MVERLETPIGTFDIRQRCLARRNKRPWLLPLRSLVDPFFQSIDFRRG
jgi:hypothetical protein